MSSHLLKRTILEMINACGNYLMPEDALRTQLSVSLPGRLLEADMQRALRELEQGGYIRGIKGALDGPVRWKITDQGKLELE